MTLLLRDSAHFHDSRACNKPKDLALCCGGGTLTMACHPFQLYRLDYWFANLHTSIIVHRLEECHGEYLRDCNFEYLRCYLFVYSFAWVGATIFDEGGRTVTATCANCGAILGFVSDRDPGTYRLYKHLLDCDLSTVLPTRDTINPPVLPRSTPSNPS